MIDEERKGTRECVCPKLSISPEMPSGCFYQRRIGGCLTRTGDPPALHTMGSHPAARKPYVGRLLAMGENLGLDLESSGRWLGATDLALHPLAPARDTACAVSGADVRPCS